MTGVQTCALPIYFGSGAVNLTGWRFNDSAGGFATAFTLPNISIQPGESIVFVEEMTPEEFREWWGTDNVPLSVQVVTYSGAELSFGAGGDRVILWDNLATSESTVVASESFGPADPGVSFTYDPTTDDLVKSQFGVNGAFGAENGDDIGSPGREASLTSSGFSVTARRVANSIRIEFDAEAGETYRLESTQTLTDNWTETGDVLTPTSDGMAFFEKPTNGSPAFFRVVKQ